MTLQNKKLKTLKEINIHKSCREITKAEAIKWYEYYNKKGEVGKFIDFFFNITSEDLK